MIRWIGAHIWDLVSRFRSDVYIDSLSSSKTSQVLLIDENEKVTTSDSFLFMPDTSGSYGVESSSSGRQALFLGEDNNLQTFITKKSHSDGGGGKLEIFAGSATATASGDNAAGGELNLYSGRGTGTGSSDVNIKTSTTIAGTASALQNDITTFSFKGKKHDQDFAILEIDDTFALLSKGSMVFGIDLDANETGKLWTWNNHASISGNGTSVMVLNEGGDLQLDGSLTLGSTLFASNSGVVQVATQGTIDHDSLANFVTAEHVDWAGASAGTIHSSNIPTLNQDTTGSAATLTTPRAINGVNFDGSAPITVTAAGSTLSDTVTVAKGGTGLTTVGTNNILTGNGTGALTSETTLQFTGDALNLTSTTGGKPEINLTSTNTGKDGQPALKLLKGATGEDGENIGSIDFIANNDDDSTILYAQVLGEISDATDGEDGGKLTLSVSSHDATLAAGLVIEDGDASGEVDATIGGGAASVTTVAGTLTMGSTATINNSGVWVGGVIPSAKLDTDTAHLTTDQTFTGIKRIDRRRFHISGGTDGDAEGDVVYFGGTTSMTIGRIYHYKSDGTWELANPNAVATSGGLLGVALGAASDTNGVLLRGMVTLDHDPGSVGKVLYLDEQQVSSAYGAATNVAPAGNNDIVRIIGYCFHASNGTIWFNPDNTFVEVTA